MSTTDRYHAPLRPCFVCREKGGLTYVEIPDHRRHWVGPDGEHVDYFGPGTDYTCSNCGAEFTVTHEGE